MQSATPRRAGRRRAHADRGFTLTEIIITTSLMGLIATVLSAALMVTFRTVDGAEGRANVARAESSIDTWLPADLASTDVNATAYSAVDLDPNATPCGNCGGFDLSGVNAMQLQWQTPGGITRVQYQYIKQGDEWVMERIECFAAEPCTRITILHDLAAPADEADFALNPTRPVWVMDVAVPDPNANPGLELSDNAREILVTINGGGSGDGAGGGANSVKLTAGGRTSEEIAPDAFTVPSFVRSQSRCGGPVTLVVDSSGSVGSAMDSVVKPGVEAFIEAFEGTPTQLQIIDFDTQARAVGSTSDWHQYYDMTEPSQVTALKNEADSQLNEGGGTNWEEAFFHTLKESDGSTAATLPNRIVFFTDGIPTLNRGKDYSSYDTSNGTVVHYNAGVYGNHWPQDRGNVFHQESWDRADVILDQHRNIDLIFVGVGAGLKENVSWIHNPTVYGNLSANPASPQTRTGSAVLAHLLANAPSGHVLATTDPSTGEYNNPETANFYDQEAFDPDNFAAAMKAAALKDCGGTLTIQTKLTDGTPVDDEFVYENSAYFDASGTQIEADPRRVTTSVQFKTGTFDFEISDATPYFDVDIVPSALETLTGYTFQGWSCKAGPDTKTLDTIDLGPDTDFEGFQVDVKPNEAVSCVLSVSQ